MVMVKYAEIILGGILCQGGELVKRQTSCIACSQSVRLWSEQTAYGTKEKNGILYSIIFKEGRRAWNTVDWDVLDYLFLPYAWGP